MILGSIDSIEVCVVVLDDPPHIAVQVRPSLFGQAPLSILGREDYVIRIWVKVDTLILSLATNVLFNPRWGWNTHC